MLDASTAVSSVAVSTARAAPSSAGAVGYAVATGGPVPRQLGVNRATLTANGFDGKPGQTFVVPSNDGVVVAVGVGDRDAVTSTVLRSAGAALARATSMHAHVATNLADADAVDAAGAAQAVVEGVLLASYRYVGLKRDESSASKLDALTLVVGSKRESAAVKGATLGQEVAAAAALARELANTPPGHLNAVDLAERALVVAAEKGLDVEVFDEDDLAEMGCGGLLGVNGGSHEPPRMIKLSYSPRNPRGHLAMVGKGITYDSGGISLKNSDAMHQVMKMDMSGAAAVLAAMSALKAAGCRSKVTAWLMCTDNMPSGTAMKLGDVLTMRNGTTVEVHNTDAEGRLVLADGLSLAVEAEPDAIVDIATLTGSALAALGPEIAAVLGTDQEWVDRVKESSERTDEAVWQLPLARDRYRKLLDSVVADVRNIGGPYGGAITASIFLTEFTGDVPYAHLDIAATMKVDGDQGIHSKGATGFGTRLLIDLACNFR